jgi:hypothetical protein
LAEGHPLIEIDELSLAFNFCRYSDRRQSTLVPGSEGIFHLDSDAATALTGDLGSLGTSHAKPVWRLLLNLHPERARTLAYADVDSTNVPIALDGNYAYCPPEAMPPGTVRTLEIPRRVGGTTLGVLFLSSQVLHSGRDDEHGHFVAGYGIG